MMTEIPIIYVKHGIANRFDSHIELNENLKKYPKLHDSILRHELSHTDEKKFNKKDLIVDLGESAVDNRELIKFMFKHPKTFIQILPFYKINGKIVYDLNMMFIWGILSASIAISIVLALVL